MRRAGLSALAELLVTCATYKRGKRRLRFSSDADIVRLTNARIIIRLDA